MTEKREQVLIRRIKRRQDKKAADELIREYYKQIYAYVYRQLGEKERSMDVTQEIFLSMLQTIWNYDSAKAGFCTWLYRIATYKVVDFYRSREYKAYIELLPENFWLEEISEEGLHSDKLSSGFSSPQVTDLEQQVTDRVFAREIFQYLRNKDIILEEIFRLKFYGEYTFEQIGKALNMPESTVKTKYYSEIKTIRNQYKEGR